MPTTYTPLLELPKHDPADYFNIQLINEGFDKTDAAIARAYRGKAAHNLLDNSDFPSAVNQRGQTSYTDNRYSIDRWKIVGACTVTPSANGVTIQATGGCQWIQSLPQDVNTRYAGQPFTFAVCLADGTVHIAKGTIPAASTNYDSAQVAIGSTGYVMNVYQQTSSYLQPRIFATAAQSAITLKWAALYIGTYTADTLPEYQPKGYAVELMECMRYYQTAYRVYGTSVDNVSREVILLHPRMRVAPTVTKISGWEGSTGAGYAVQASGAGYVDIQYTGWGNVSLAFSADL